MTDQPPEPDPFTAAVALQTAIDQLTQPGTVELQRDIPVPGTDAWQLVADDNALEQSLHQQIAEAVALACSADEQLTAADDRYHRGVKADDLELIAQGAELARHARQKYDRAARQTTDAHEGLQQLAARRAARTATAAPVPSLLEQLADAVESSGGGAGGPAAAASRRSPIGLDAADLLRRIQTTTSSPTTWPGPLTEHVRAWARHRSSTQDHETITAAATDAQAWADTARDLLTPHRRMQLVRPCPACNQRHARTTTDGETTITAALQLDLTDKIARCLRCGTTWREDQFDLLAKVLDQTDDHTEARR